MEEIIITQAVENIINESSYPEETVDIFLFTKKELEKRNIFPTEIQLVVLTNHLGEMIRRSKENEKLMAFDIEIFADVPEDSLELSEKIVNKIGNIVDEEKYVLSVHFETAKLN